MPVNSIAFFLTVFATTARAQTLQTLRFFNNSINGAYPAAALVLGTDGNFYGTAVSGGIKNLQYGSGMGAVFKATPTGVLTTLLAFSDTNNANGANPFGGLTLGDGGNLYGTTSAGGSVTNSPYPPGMGTVFKISTNGVLTTLHFFNYIDGENPRGTLIFGKDGNLFGTTIEGGSSGYGTVFKITTNGALTTLVSFNYTNGGLPYGGLTLGLDGNFYGTTSYGGSGGYGTIFRLTTNGVVTTVAEFSGTNGGNAVSALTLGNDGNFYGTTSQGGITNSQSPPGSGTVFKLTPNGTLSTLVFFNRTNGATPSAALLLGNDGNFYGTTAYGGAFDWGTVFKMTTDGTLTTLVSFDGTNGASPQAGLTLGIDNKLYGTTSEAPNDFQNSGTFFVLSIIQVVPPKLDLRFSAGFPELTLTGLLSNNYIIQYNTNLAEPNWLDLLSVSNLVVSPYLFLDTFGGGQSARFYRAFMH